MAVKGNGVTMGGKGSGRIGTLVGKGKISQTGIRRELAAQRKAFGAKGVTRAMKNWASVRARASSPPRRRASSVPVAASAEPRTAKAPAGRE